MDELVGGAFWTGFAANLALAAYAWSVLPARSSALQTGVVLLLGTLLALNGRLLRSRPDRINLPRKDYWLAPERREATLRWLESSMRWFGAAAFALLFDVFTQVLRMNLGRTGRLEHAPLSLGLFAAFSVVWTALLFRRFAKPA